MVADKLIIKLSNSKNEEEFNHLYDMGMTLNNICVYYLNIYLD